jgi:hypothetical protein
MKASMAGKAVNVDQDIQLARLPQRMSQRTALEGTHIHTHHQTTTHNSGGVCAVPWSQAEKIIMIQAQQWMIM